MGLWLSSSVFDVLAAMRVDALSAVSRSDLSRAMMGLGVWLVFNPALKIDIFR